MAPSSPAERRLRLLLIAPTANRDATGEAVLAYEWVSRLAARHDVTVLTYYQRRTGSRLSRQLPGVRIIEWAEPVLVGRHERFNAMLNPGYIPFRTRARRWIRRARRAGQTFDIAHQVAPVSLRYASPLTGCGIPYVVGPVGGSLASPPGFAAEENGAPWFTALRGLDGWRLRHDPGLRRSFARAGRVLGIAPYVATLLRSVPVRSFQSFSDVGIDALPAQSTATDRTRAVRFLFVGRVIRTKGVRDAIRALAQLPEGTANLDIVGDGYDTMACRALAETLGVSSTVRFHGRVPHDEVDARYREADVFLFPSYREAGGIVVVEAMSHGLPVIVCDRGGPAAAVAPDCGIRVRADEPVQYARDLAAAMAALAADPPRRARMGAAARRRTAETSLWDRRIEAVEQVYAEVLAVDHPK